MPTSVGIAAASRVHLKLPVSFFIVSSAVEQGQCISEKIITFTAVFTVHPFKVKSRYVSARAAVSLSVPSARYAIIIKPYYKPCGSGNCGGSA